MTRPSRNSILALVLLFLTTMAFADEDGYLDLDAVKKAIQEKGANWQAADNPLLQKSLGELRGLLTQETPKVAEGDVFFEVDKSMDLPSSLDWRDNNGNFVTAVRNQSSCGSCWAFAVTAALEARDAVANNKNNPTTDLSEQNVLSCSGAGSCSGGYTSSAMNFLRDTGTPDESCFPYTATNNSCSNHCSDWESRVMKAKSWSWVTTSNYTNITAIKNALMDGPVTTSFQVYSDFYSYGSGVYEHVYGTYEGGHAVVIVGWNDSEQAWIVKNSWGSWWGMSGYFKIKWSEVGIGSWVQNVIAYENCTDCYIEGACYDDGQVNPGNTCEVCDVSQSSSDWSVQSDGVSCDDGAYCTVTDSCLSGVCVGQSRNCDDGLYCTGAEVCDEASDECVHSGDPCPDNNNVCDGITSCNETLNQCQTSDPPDCNDGNLCTDDQCDPINGCWNSNNNNSCDDGLHCNGVDTCSNGSCSLHSGNPCNDQCQECNEELEQCEDLTGSCDDTLYCNGPDSCEGGTCSVHEGSPCGDDGQFCNGSEYCDESGNQCLHTGTPCPDDDQYCNGEETCNETIDLCEHSGNPCGDDGVFCNGAESCNEQEESCEHEGNPCTDDDNFCNGEEWCDEDGEQCQHTGDPCTGLEGENPWQCYESRNTCVDGGYLMFNSSTWEGERWLNEEHAGTWFPDTIEDEQGADFHIDEDGYGQIRTIDDLELGVQFYLELEPGLDGGADNEAGYIGFGEGAIPGAGRFVGLKVENGNMYLYDSAQVPPEIEAIGTYTQGENIEIHIEMDENGALGVDSHYFNGTYSPPGFSPAFRLISAVEDSDDGYILRDVQEVDSEFYGCVIDFVYYDDGELDPDNPCMVCVAQDNAFRWEEVTDGASCDDGLFCNGADQCLSGVCDTHAGMPCQEDSLFCNGIAACDETADSCYETGDPCGDDGAFCNGEESCNEALDECVSSGDPCGDDGIFCNGEDSCNETADQCDHTGDPCPENGDVCDGVTSCNESFASCQTTEALVCDDGNECTDDSCDAITGCTYSNNDSSCDDGNFCNGADSCSGGACQVHVGDPCDPQCQSCNESAGSCDNLTISCDDGKYCNGVDTCSGGSCSAHVGSPCGDDGVFCNGQEACDENTDQCLHDGDPCAENGDVCDGVMSCNENLNRCESTEPLNCEDNNACTDEVCDPVFGCQYTNNSDACDDGIFCNGADNCSGGSCSAHAGNPCPSDDELFCNGTETSECIESTNSCGHTGNPCPVDDGLYCNGEETSICDESKDECGHTGNPCPSDDGIFCNGPEACDEGSDECIHEGDPCAENGDVCDGVMSCNESQNRCDTTDPLNCEDSNACTDDSCDPVSGCQYVNNSDPCDDGLYCNGADHCSGGSCQAHAGNPCPIDDGIFCNGEETAECDESLDSCNHSGNPCPEDEYWCNGEESCDEAAGECLQENVPDCDDGIPCTADICLEEGPGCSAVSECEDWIVGPQCPTGALPESSVFINVEISSGTDVDELGFTLTYNSDLIRFLDYYTNDCLVYGWNDFVCNDEEGTITCSGSGDPSEVIGDACIVSFHFYVESDIWESVAEFGVESLTGDLEMMTVESCSTFIGCENDGQCSDDLYCDGTEWCDSGLCKDGNSPCPVDDGLFCNGEELCQEETDECVHSGDPCESDEICDEQEGLCVPVGDDDDTGDDDTGDDDISDDDDDNDDDDEEECGECDGKVSELTLEYLGHSAVFVEIVQHKGEVAFSDEVLPNEQFTFEGLDKMGTLSAKIKVYVDEELHTEIHTSCSIEIGPGYTIGDFKVIEGFSRNGGRLCPLEPGDDDDDDDNDDDSEDDDDDEPTETCGSEGNADDGACG